MNIIHCTSTYAVVFDIDLDLIYVLRMFGATKMFIIVNLITYCVNMNTLNSHVFLTLSYDSKFYHPCLTFGL